MPKCKVCYKQKRTFFNYNFLFPHVAETTVLLQPWCWHLPRSRISSSSPGMPTILVLVWVCAAGSQMRSRIYYSKPNHLLFLLIRIGARLNAPSQGCTNDKNSGCPKNVAALLLLGARGTLTISRPRNLWVFDHSWIRHALGTRLLYERTDISVRMN